MCTAAVSLTWTDISDADSTLAGSDVTPSPWQPEAGETTPLKPPIPTVVERERLADDDDWERVSAGVSVYAASQRAADATDTVGRRHRPISVEQQGIRDFERLFSLYRDWFRVVVMALVTSKKICYSKPVSAGKGHGSARKIGEGGGDRGRPN